MKKPLLTIGMIFRDDIRCIERCLKALQPLRDAVPCELIMADTGSADGSREVAERYADVVFDFPWINDFAAARNAVMERASGDWYLSVDTDEYLEPDIAQVKNFLRNPQNVHKDICLVVIRNYQTYEMDGAWSDFLAIRLLRMATGKRYSGAIHEQWDFPEDQTPRSTVLNQMIFKHDGYVGMNEEAGREKRERNLKLIREELEKTPDRLLRLLQFIESGQKEPDYMEWLFRAVDRVREKAPTWDRMGPPILRYAVRTAATKKLPELQEWVALAEEMFPESYFTRIDIAYFACIETLGRKDYALCINLGGKMLQAYADYRAGRGDIIGQMFSSLLHSGEEFERNIINVVAVAYLEDGKPRKALDTAMSLDFSQLTAEQTENLINLLFDLHLRTDVDTSRLTSDLWDGINRPVPNQKRADERHAAFILRGASTFLPDYRADERKRADFHRPTYTVFLPLADRIPFGLAASMLETTDTAELNALLNRVQKWPELPISALSHALSWGAVFPPEKNPLNLEDLEDVATRLSRNWTVLCSTLTQTASEDFAGSWQTLTWARTLALLAVQHCDWKDAEQSMALARIFAKVERAFVSGYYAPEVLREGNLHVLPSMHRFGWYCAQAFEALEAGDQLGHVRFLRAGLASCPSMKDMVEFLIEHTSALQAPSPNSELRELAEKVRALLSAYSPDDPAVAALKASPVYQKVAHLLEEDPT